MKSSLNFLVLTTTLVDLGFLIGLLERLWWLQGKIRFVCPFNTGLLSSGDLELAVGHLYRLSFLEEESQSW